MTRLCTPIAASAFFAAICFGASDAKAADKLSKQLEDAKKRFWSEPADETKEADGKKRAVTDKGFPLINGIWNDGVEGDARQVVKFEQTDGQFAATCVYQNPKEGEFHWRFEGSITKEGHITGKLHHTKGPKYILEHIQIHVAALSLDGKQIRGRAIYHDGGGGHDYSWSRSEKNETPEVAGRDSKPSDPWKDANIGARAGDLFVCVTDIRIGKVALTALGKDATSQDNLLKVSLHISNDSDTKKHHYSGWSYTALDIDRSDNASVSDQLGNRYGQHAFGITADVVGQLKDGASIYPRKTVADLLILESPVDRATELRFSLPGKVVGVDGTLRLKVPIKVANAAGVMFNRDEEAKAKIEREKEADARAKVKRKRELEQQRLSKPDPERDERASESMMGNARTLLRAGNAAGYQDTLKKIIEKYPNTKAAESARKKLK